MCHWGSNENTQSIFGAKIRKKWCIRPANSTFLYTYYVGFYWVQITCLHMSVFHISVLWVSETWDVCLDEKLKRQLRLWSTPRPFIQICINVRNQNQRLFIFKNLPSILDQEWYYFKRTKDKDFLLKEDAVKTDRILSLRNIITLETSLFSTSHQ